MLEDFCRAKELLKKFKGEDYAFGDNALNRLEEYSGQLGRRVAIVSGLTAKRTGLLSKIVERLERGGIKIAGIISGARPNTPKEDVYRIAYQLLKISWDFVLAVGGGSCLDGVKAAMALASRGGIIEDYLGVGKVSEISRERIPLLAIQMASGSASHLTKYANVTDMIILQKKLIVDEAIIPPKAIFQYDVTTTSSPELTKDGALDGFSHCWEVWMNASGKGACEEVGEIAYLGMKLIVENLPKIIENPEDSRSRYALGLATDLGGYSIMIGGTGAGHLGSFSLVDVLPHGRACAILNPYYTVLFASAIQDQLRRAAGIFKKAGYIEGDIESLEGRQLAEAVARAMMKFTKCLGIPTTLKEAGATERHIEKMVAAAKDPQLKMKLQSLPIPIDPEAGDVERLIEPTLYAAYTGNLAFIPRID